MIPDTGATVPDADERMLEGPIAVIEDPELPPQKLIQTAPSRQSREWALLVLILLVAAFLRFKGVDWGGNLYLHPDERFHTMVVTRIQWPAGPSEYLDSVKSPLNPYNNEFPTYIYGTFPLFMAKLLGEVVGQTVYGDAHLPGRILSGICDLFTILLVYLVGRRLFGGSTGLLAAALLAVTVLHIQASHFMAPDLFVVVFCLAAFYFALRADGDDSWHWYLAAGVAVGLAMASKISAVPIAAVLAMPLLARMRRAGIRSVVRPQAPRGLRPAVGLVVGIVAAVVTFRFAQPSAFLGPSLLSFRLDPRWVNDIRYWREVQSGAADTPPALQWADRTPVVFGIRNLVLWGMGPLLGLAAVASLCAATLIAITRRRLPPIWFLVLIGWPAFHLAYYGISFVPTMRYYLPAYPFLILLAAAALMRLARFGRQRGWPRIPMPRGAALPLGMAPAIVVLVGTALYAFAFSDIYSSPPTREAASRWIYGNVPAGSVIASEHWDDGIPVPLPGFDTRAYQGFQLELFFPDDEHKLTTMLGQLDQADYIVVTSNRLYAVIPRMPERFPMTSEYYSMLFSGELGFELVHEETSYPSLFGIELVDDSAEEAFTVYDHPKVFVFRKSEGYSRAAIEPRLVAALGNGGIAIGPLDAGVDMLMMDDGTRSEQQAGGTWREMFNPGDLANRSPTLFWYLALHLMALAALPFCWRLFGRLPDRGYAAAKTIGVLMTTYVAWMLASVGVLSFGRGAVILGVAVTAVLSIALTWRRWPHLGRDLRARWRTILATETIFLALFLAMVWVRTQNPDLWHRSRGGEKPMDFAYFNAVLKSTSFPPYDPWFAGGELNYYYFGFVQWASVTRVTGIVPEVAYNLAVPSILALLALNVWSLAVGIVSRTRSTGDEAPPLRILAIGLIAPLLVIGLGNLDLARRVGRGEFGFEAADSRFNIPGLNGLADIVAGIGYAIAQRPELPDDLYWSATRVIPGTINEFPLFTFLFADLHAHMMAMPLLSVALLLALQAALDHRDRFATVTDRPWHPAALRFHGSVVLEVLAAGLITSALYATNTWDFPTAVALLVGARVIRELSGDPIRPTYPGLVGVGLWAVGVFAAGRIMFWPFYANFHTRGGFVEFHERSPLDSYLSIHGLLLFAMGGYIAFRLIQVGARRPTSVEATGLQPELAGQAGIIDRMTGPVRFTLTPMVEANPVLLIGIAAGAAVAGGLLGGSLPLFLTGALALVAVTAWTYRDRPALLVTLMLAAVAIALSLMVEFVALEGDIGRMNTVFKFYLQIWILLGVAAAVAIMLVLTDRSLRHRFLVDPWLIIVVALMLGAAIYPVLAGQARVGDRFTSLPPTLDGMAYMDTAVYDDAPEGRSPVEFSLAGDHAAIEWLRLNIDGSPVVLEAWLPGYRWGSRVSVYTGLPTVLGWDWHQTQQRPGFGNMIHTRRADVARMLGEVTTFEEIRPLLDQYGVRLIYIGDLERAYYDATTLSKFDQAVADGFLTVIYQDQGVTIYEYGAT